jgi:2,5-diketo-D-gluconate reductase A
MPCIGLGTGSKLTDAAARTVVPRAIEAGYRMVDTAERYGNEKGVGAGLRASGLPREQMFITTKFNVQWHGRDLVRTALERSADRLGMDYVDLFLIHWPNPQLGRYVEAWEGMIDLLQAGRTRAIGTSNFTPAHLERLLDATGVLPPLNQIQLNPTVVRQATRTWHATHGIVTQSWAPLGKGGLLGEPVLATIGARYTKSPAQVVLRWHLDLGLVPQPGSITETHLHENIDIFDFALTREEIDEVSALDTGRAVVTDPDVFGH